jgi:predicted DNA-binding ribbon-helix-helix protein
LEDEFWSALKEIAAAKDSTLSALVEEIDNDGHQGNLASAIRIYILKYFRRSAIH